MSRHARSVVTLALFGAVSCATVSSTPSAAEAQLVQIYSHQAEAGGTFLYSFTLEQRGPLIETAGWYIPADVGSNSPPADATGLVNPVLVGPAPAPWISLGSSVGGHTGPVFNGVTTVWTPTGVGDRRTFKIRANNSIPCSSAMYWSAIFTMGTPPITFRRAECLGLCGNGILDPGEGCDDGNHVGTDACTNACQAAICGDGFVRAGVEQCDDGNPSNTDACLDTCVPATCGDGFTQAGVEQCDDDNGVDTDACLTSCELATLSAEFELSKLKLVRFDPFFVALHFTVTFLSLSMFRQEIVIFSLPAA